MKYVLQERRASLRFSSLDALEDALKVFSADPVIDIALLPKSTLFLHISGIELQMPDLAPERVKALLQRYEVPFTWSTAS